MKRNKKIKTIRSILIGLVTIGTVVGATWSLTACGSSDEKDKHTITIKGLHDPSLTVGHVLPEPFEWTAEDEFGSAISSASYQFTENAGSSLGQFNLVSSATNSGLTIYQTSGATASGSASGMLTVSKAGYASPQPFPITIQINAGKIRIDGLPTRYMSVNDESARFKWTAEDEFGSAISSASYQFTEDAGSSLGQFNLISSTNDYSGLTIYRTSASTAISSGSTSGTLTVSKAGYTTLQSFLITIRINVSKIIIDGPDARYMSVNNQSASFNWTAKDESGSSLTASFWFKENAGSSLGQFNLMWSTNSSGLTIDRTSASAAITSGSTSGMLTVSKAGYTSPQPLLITIYIVDDDQIIIDGLTTQSMSVNQYEQFNWIPKDLSGSAISSASYQFTQNSGPSLSDLDLWQYYNASSGFCISPAHPLTTPDVSGTTSGMLTFSKDGYTSSLPFLIIINIIDDHITINGTPNIAEVKLLS